MIGDQFRSPSFQGKELFVRSFTTLNESMIVSIAGLPEIDPFLAPFHMDGMKMFVGKKGDQVDVYGNSSHPNAKFLTEKVGYNWAFVASGSASEDIAVVELGLPLSV